MCSTIITTRFPIKLVACIQAGKSTTKFAGRYLTCGARNFQWLPNTNSNYAERPDKYLNSHYLSQQLDWKYGFSTLPKDNPLGNKIITEMSVDKQKPVENSEKEELQKEDVLDVTAAKKLGLFARFKLMYKQYWYVLIPVHVITSIGWFGGFYYLSQSGVDIPALLHSLRVSETVIDRLKDSSMGHVAIAYLCYKISTPIRYMVTLGGTTVSIKYLEQYGYIKPMPTKSQLMQMYEDKKADRAKRKQDRLKED